MKPMVFALLLAAACGGKEDSPPGKETPLPPSPPAPLQLPTAPLLGTVEDRANRVVERYFALMKDFDDVFGEPDGDCDVKVSAVEAFLARSKDRVDELRQLLDDVAVARAAYERITDPKDYTPEDIINVHHGGLFVEGYNMTCKLDLEWNESVQHPVWEKLGRGAPPPDAGAK